MALTDIINDVNSVQNALNGNVLSNGSGFNAQNVPGADGNGLPFSKVPSNRPSHRKRNIITWFVPEFGIVTMYVNPESITYTDKKLITKDRTKGGYTLQYWGEDLTSINISGTTGSSGIEGINLLNEVYRAEQLAFDAVGLTLAANNASAPNLLGAITGASSPTTLGAISAIGGLLGMDSPNTALVANSIQSLAQLAFTVEFYYGGEVRRGYFESMTVNEKANSFAIEYNIVFISTQKRGTRLNYFPFSRSPVNGASAYNTPNSFSGNVIG